MGYVENQTPYFEGRDSIPNLPHLIVVPCTLTSQWIREIAKFVAAGSFQVVQYCSQKENLGQFFSAPSSDYVRAAGPNGSKAGRVIVIADQSVS
jgi:hypothetical protein